MTTRRRMLALLGVAPAALAMSRNEIPPTPRALTSEVLVDEMRKAADAVPIPSTPTSAQRPLPFHVDLRMPSDQHYAGPGWHVDLDGVDLCDEQCFYADSVRGEVGLYVVSADNVVRTVHGQPEAEWRKGEVRIVPPWERGPHTTFAAWHYEQDRRLMSQHVLCDRCASDVTEQQREYVVWIGREYRELCTSCRIVVLQVADASVSPDGPNPAPHKVPRSLVRTLLGLR